MSPSGLDPPDLARGCSPSGRTTRVRRSRRSADARTLARQLEGTEKSELATTIEASAAEIVAIVDRLALVARIQEGRYAPALVEARSDDLAHAAAAALGTERVRVTGVGDAVLVDRAPVEDALIACARAIMRHGAIDEMTIDVAGSVLSYASVLANARPVMSGSETREFGLGVSLIVLKALGSTLTLEGERFVVSLPKELR